MNKTVVVILQLILIVGYLASVFFVFDSSTGMGLAQIGGTSAVVLILVLVLEKRKDKEVENGDVSAVVTSEAVSEQPATASVEAAPVEQPVAEPVQESVPGEQQPPQ